MDLSSFTGGIHSLTTTHRHETAALLMRTINLALDFKLQPEIFRLRQQPSEIRDLIVTELPDQPAAVDEVLTEFARTVLPLCKNEASPRFLGFGDTGDDVAALVGGILALFTQQNLINQSFDSPSATFIEISVLRWLRDLLGFTNPCTEDVSTVWDVGGVITHGGTMSNAVAMMLAREHKAPGTLKQGVIGPERFGVVVPRGIGHYSVKSALTWLGVGTHVIEVDTVGYRYDLTALKRALRDHAGRVMAVVAYAGESRTQSIDDLRAVHYITRSADHRVWLHADACWGLLCAFSNELQPKIDGIACYDSVTVDPHKVMAVPYKRARVRPAELAGAVAEALRSDTESPVVEVAVSGPGFLNLTLADPALWRQVAARLAGPRLGVGTPEQGRRTVIDYSGPNIAKEMHVGHLRTTIIGDCLARVLGFLGGEVVRQNHLGDWGTQFGMLIQYLDEHPETAWHHDQLSDGTSTVSALDKLYRAARAAFDADPAFADRARTRVVALQAGDEATVARWREIVAESEFAFREIYDRLGVLLQPEDSAGESCYNPWLADVVEELTALGIAVESDGALVVYSDETTGPDGNPVTLMVRKKDGGYGYDTTDLATIRYRIRDLKADRILYVVDSRQSLHFRLVFEVARRAGWLTDDTDVTHVAFGTVLGPDGKPFKTRSGDTVKLMNLLDAAVDRARATMAEKANGPSGGELNGIAEQAGIGAVKYADLSTSRTKDYVFDVDRMVSFNGNTGVYLQYAHTRICSILRKAGDGPVEVDPSLPLHPAERALALALDSFGDTLAEVARMLEPHRLCGYLYDLAKAFTDFYEVCPVVSADQPTRANRVALCHLTARTLREGLGLLGIAAPERM